jgi:hypothetical protein
MLTPEMAFLKAIRKADIRGDGSGIVGQRVEKGPWLKTRQVERNDHVRRWSPPNLEISLIPEIAGVAGIARVDQGVASKGVYPVVR